MSKVPYVLLIRSGMSEQVRVITGNFRGIYP